MTVTCFENLDAWKTARALTNRIYDVSDHQPFARDFGLKDQIRRAAVSAMSNIAEGFESRTRRLFVDYLGRAKASAGEVRCQLYVALDRNYLSREVFDELSDTAAKTSSQIYRLMDYLRRLPPDG